MAFRIEHECEVHEDPWDCPMHLIIEDDEDGWVMPVHDGRGLFIAINYCPWCGTKLRPDAIDYI